MIALIRINGRKTQSKISCSLCKKMFNSNYEGTHSELMHKEEKVKYSYVLEGPSHLTLTSMPLRHREHIFEGSLTMNLDHLWITASKTKI